MLYPKPCYSKLCYKEVVVYLNKGNIQYIVICRKHEKKENKGIQIKDRKGTVKSYLDYAIQDACSLICWEKFNC